MICTLHLTRSGLLNVGQDAQQYRNVLKNLIRKSMIKMLLGRLRRTWEDKTWSQKDDRRGISEEFRKCCFEPRLSIAL